MPAQSPGVRTLNTGPITARLHPMGMFHDNEVRDVHRGNGVCQWGVVLPERAHEAIGHSIHQNTSVKVHISWISSGPSICNGLKERLVLEAINAVYWARITRLENLWKCRPAYEVQMCWKCQIMSIIAQCWFFPLQKSFFLPGFASSRWWRPAYKVQMSWNCQNMSAIAWYLTFF